MIFCTIHVICFTCTYKNDTLYIFACSFKLLIYFELKDVDKMERTSRRINELEQINNNTKLLMEMLDHYSPESSSKADLDMMKVRILG